MDELTAVLLVLGVILTIVTLVGHGIWVLLAAMFGQRPRTPQSRHLDHFGGERTCPRCFARLGIVEQSCLQCGWPKSIDETTSKALVLRAMRRQLDQFASRGAADAETRAKLLAVIDEEERRLVAIEATSRPEPEVISIKPAEIAEAVPAKPLQDASSAAGIATPLSLTVEERAQQYAASREAAAAEAVMNAGAAHSDVETPKRREALSRLFAAFMEEKNIRWGELVGGLLIVGCSIALVISFWSQIAARPLLKFVLFNGVTAALFGVGMYTDRRWKIHTTSHGILIIAALLVPLNFLAIAAFTQTSPPTDLLSLVGEAISLAFFAMLVYLAGRILVPGDEALLMAGVMIPCLMQLLVRRFAGPLIPLTWLYGLAAVPIASYLAVTTRVARKQWQSSRHTPCAVAGEPDTIADGTRSVPATLELQANRMLAFLGLVSAATLVPIALLVFNVPPPQTTLHWLSPLVAICGLPAILVGLFFWRRITHRELTGLQTAGISVGALGAMVMVGAAVLAWPDPATLLPTALMTTAAMLAVALWFGIPAAHVPAGIATAAAWLVGFYLMRGDIDWTVGESATTQNVLLSATSGHALVPLVALFGGVAAWLRSRNRGESALMYGIVAAAVAAGSLGLLVWFGFARIGDPHGVTWSLAIYAIAALAAGVVLDRADVTRVGSALMLAAFVQGIVFRYGEMWQLEQPWIAALLAHATLAAAGAALLRLPWTAARTQARSAWIWSAQVTSLAAAVWIAATMHTSSTTALSINLAWLAGVWLLLSILGNWQALFMASQVSLVLAIFCGVTAAVETRPWYIQSRHPWLDPWFVEAQGIALAGYCLIVAAFREVATQSAKRQSQYVIEPPTPAWRSASEELLNPRWPAIDHLAQCAIVLMLIVVTTYGVAPGAAQELSPTETVGSRVVPPIERFEIVGIPHSHAADEGAWMLLAAVGLTLTSGLRQGEKRWRIAGLIILAMLVCSLLATQWEAEIATASALRWLTAGMFAVLSCLIWWRQRGTSTALHETWRFQEMRALVVALITLVYAAMGAYVIQSAFMQANTPARLNEIWPWAFVWALLAGAAGLVIPYASVGHQHAGETSTSRASAWRLRTREVLMLLAVAPLVVLFAFTIAKALDARPIVGPEPGTWFQRIGLGVSYGVPLSVIALVFIGYAIRDRLSQFAFAAGLLFNAVATIAVLTRLARGQAVLDGIAWITVAQVNAIVAGVATLVWLAAISWHRRKMKNAEPHSAGELQWPALLFTQVSFAAALCGTYLAPAVVRLVDEPDFASAWLTQAGDARGWIGLAIAVAAAVWLNWRRAFPQPIVAYFTAAIVAIIAISCLRWDTGNWLAYHVLLTGSAAAAWLVPLITLAVNRSIGNVRNDAFVRWSAASVRAFGMVAVVLALRALDGDPAAPWWTVAALAAISARNVWIAWREGGRGSLWIAAVLGNIAASAWWVDVASRFSATQGPGEAVEFFWVNAIALAAMAIVSVWVERRSLAKRFQQPPGVALHRFAAWAIVGTLLVTTVGGLLDDLSGNFFASSVVLECCTWLAGVAAALACLWDPAIRWPIACLYLYGLVAVGMFLNRLDLQAPMFHWALANALAAYSLATSALWSGRERLREVASRLGVPTAVRAKPQAAWGVSWFEGSGHGWLVPVNSLLGVFVLILVAWIEQILQSFPQRMVAAYAVGAQAVALGLLARGTVRTPLQYTALVWGVFFAVAFGWAWMPPNFAAPWLHRLVIASVALAIMVIIYGFGVVKFLKRENEWTRAAVRLVPVLAVLAAGLIFAVLGIEVRAFILFGGVPIVWSAILAIGLALAGLTAGALAAALLPGRDPLGLSERGRTAYVYAAEALLALLFLHIRVSMPWLFRGWFQQFWPLVVMGIAFVGVGFGELFQRRKQRVLSEPLQTTGALLPLLPAIGFWVVSSRVDYSVLLLSIGVLYAALSVVRQSFFYGVLAALAANGSLWYLLSQRDGLSLTEHPQLWLIPPALCALVAGYINRERLTTQQSAALRYAAAIVIYVSSTADVFINGVAEAPWLPGVLAGLSILGVFAGILLQVRAFLYLGTAFLVVALMTIIWHAAREQTWIWWVAGIVTGALILALLGFFEKRRDDVLRVVEELKHWEA